MHAFLSLLLSAGLGFGVAWQSGAEAAAHATHTLGSDAPWMDWRWDGSYMSPIFAMDNTSNGGMMYAEHTTQLANGIYPVRVKLAYPQNVVFSEFRPSVILAFHSGRVAPSLLFAILHIVFLRAYSQMRGVAALAVITSMHDHEVFGDGAVYKFIRDAMSAQGPILVREFAVAVYSSLFPFPTIIGVANVNSLPKSGCERLQAGVERGTLRHVSRSFQRLTMPRDVSASPWRFCCLTTGVV